VTCVSINTLTKVKFLAGTATVVALAGALAACGSSGGGNSNNGSGGSSGSVVVQVGQGARLSGQYAAGQFTGWIPSGMYPSDITASAQEFNTGDLVAPSDLHAWASMTCSQALEATAAPGFGEVAYLVDQGANQAQQAAYTYGVYEFATADQATAFVKQAAAKFEACASFTYSPSSGGSLPVKLAVGPSSEAAEVTSADVAVDLRETLIDGGKTVAGDLVFAADGNMVVALTSAGPDQVPTEVDNGKIAQKMLAGLTAGEAANPTPSGVSTVPAASPTVPGSSGNLLGDRAVRVYTTADTTGGGLR
jgi:hypothetical protein